MGSYFINEGIHYMINSHVNNINTKSLLNYFLQSLFIIYGEHDIVNPLVLNDEKILINNLQKYELDDESLNNFFMLINNYYIKEKNNILPNPFFAEIQKSLIDMFVLKLKLTNVLDKDVVEFRDSLFLPESKDPIKISLTYLYDTGDINNYLNNQLNQIEVIISPKELLTPDAYRVVNMDYTVVSLLTKEEVDYINDEVYSKLEVNKNLVNFDYMFEQKLHDFLNKDKPILSTGNGYVDILLVFSVITTIVMIILVIVLYVVK